MWVEYPQEIPADPPKIPALGCSSEDPRVRGRPPRIPAENVPHNIPKWRVCPELARCSSQRSVFLGAFCASASLPAPHRPLRLPRGHLGARQPRAVAARGRSVPHYSPRDDLHARAGHALRAAAREATTGGADSPDAHGPPTLKQPAGMLHQLDQTTCTTAPGRSPGRAAAASYPARRTRSSRWRALPPGPAARVASGRPHYLPSRPAAPVRPPPTSAANRRPPPTSAGTGRPGPLLPASAAGPTTGGDRRR